MLNDILNRFQGMRETGENRWKALCPAHDDRNPSLSISLNCAKILLHCHAGCSTDAILRAAGLKTRDLFFDAAPERKRQPVGPKIEHRYEDENGKHIFSVFRQYFDDGKKTIWSYPAPGINVNRKRELMMQYIYRLPDVLFHLQYDGQVYIVEGEKAADTCWKNNIPATCNPGGAGKWSDRHSAWLQYVVPADVVILPDNDEPGRLHAEKVARSLYRADPRMKIQIINLPGLTDKGDIYDWISRLAR
jgi:putative DNA primase/helicase